MRAGRTAYSQTDAASGPTRPSAASPSNRPAPPLVVTRTYEPDLERQVRALLMLLRARPNDDRVGQPRREAAKSMEGG